VTPGKKKGRRVAGGGHRNPRRSGQPKLLGHGCDDGRAMTVVRRVRGRGGRCGRRRREGEMTTVKIG
jgi:hypothetical protein